MIGGIERFVPEDRQAEGVTSEQFEPWSHDLGGHGWRLGGSPGAVILERGSMRLLVQCHEFAWYQNTWGPILPVLPVLMGVGTYCPNLAIRLRAQDRSTPVALTLEEVRVRVDGCPDQHGPARWSREEHPRFDGKESELESPGMVELAAGESVWIVYELDNRATPAFDLLLPLDSLPLRLHFRQERTPFLFIAP